MLLWHNVHIAISSIYDYAELTQAPIIGITYAQMRDIMDSLDCQFLWLTPISFRLKWRLPQHAVIFVMMYTGEFSYSDLRHVVTREDIEVGLYNVWIRIVQRLIPVLSLTPRGFNIRVWVKRLVACFDELMMIDTGVDGYIFIQMGEDPLFVHTSSRRSSSCGN
jgi:hypothetical protein